MSDNLEKKVDVEAAAANDSLEPIESIKAGLTETYEDKTNKEFYGGSITDSYRLKSELVGKAMEDIGMGRYQWEIFIVTGFGWICGEFLSKLDSYTWLLTCSVVRQFLVSGLTYDPACRQSRVQ